MNKRVRIFLLLLAGLLGVSNMAFAADFSDTKGHWAEEYIHRAVQEGIINGYPDGTFRPEDEITQGEFYKMINRFGKFNDRAPVSFSDVKESDWYFDEVSIAIATGYLEDSTEKLEANKYLLRNEGARIIASIYHMDEDPDYVKKFSDEEMIVNPGSVGALTKFGIINGYPDGTFGPLKPIRRGEAAKMLFLSAAGLGDPKEPKKEVYPSPDYLSRDPLLDGEVEPLPEFYYQNLPPADPATGLNLPPDDTSLKYLGWMFESRIVLPAQVPANTPEEGIKAVLNEHYKSPDGKVRLEFFFYQGGKKYSVKADVFDWIITGRELPGDMAGTKQFIAVPVFSVSDNLPIEKENVVATYMFLPELPISPLDPGEGGETGEEPEEPGEETEEPEEPEEPEEGDEENPEDPSPEDDDPSEP